MFFRIALFYRGFNRKQEPKARNLCNIMSQPAVLSFQTVCKPYGKKWNAKEKNTEQKVETKSTLKVKIT